MVDRGFYIKGRSIQVSATAHSTPGSVLMQLNVQLILSRVLLDLACKFLFTLMDMEDLKRVDLGIGIHPKWTSLEKCALSLLTPN